MAAHPHYPEPRWGTRLRPYREVVDGIRVLRIPLWIGRETAAARVRQEASFALALLASMPLLGKWLMKRPDAMLVVSPSFPALLPAIVNSRLRRLPLALWLHDLLPDGAVASGLLEEGGLVLKASRWLERTAYREADRIIVLSSPFGQNLREKGVPAEKIKLIYDPATRGVPAVVQATEPDGDPRVLCMGNIGLTQGLAPLVRDFEASDQMSDLNVKLVITGNGVAADEVRAEIRSDRVEMPGLVENERLEQELRSARLALVSQAYEGTEFNLPSKLMNYMAYGLPVIAAVNPRSEAARLVREAEAGWVADSSEPGSLPTDNCRSPIRSHRSRGPEPRRSSIRDDALLSASVRGRIRPRAANTHRSSVARTTSRRRLEPTASRKRWTRNSRSGNRRRMKRRLTQVYHARSGESDLGFSLAPGQRVGGKWPPIKPPPPATTITFPIYPPLSLGRRG